MAKQSKIDYSKGLIYNVWYGDELFYTGSTTNFIDRKSRHKKQLKGVDKQQPFHQKMNEMGILCEDLRFEQYELYPCNSKRELERKEGEIQRLLKPKYINNLASRSHEEWNLDNKEKIKEYNKQYFKKYYAENRDKALKYSQGYRLNNKEKKAETDRKYREKNKDKIKELYEKNKDSINEKCREKITCECGQSFNKNCKKRHEKSLKHQKYVNSIKT
jgi:hypothetical protein